MDLILEEKGRKMEGMLVSWFVIGRFVSLFACCFEIWMVLGNCLMSTLQNFISSDIEDTEKMLKKGKVHFRAQRLLVRSE